MTMSREELEAFVVPVTDGRFTVGATVPGVPSGLVMFGTMDDAVQAVGLVFDAFDAGKEAVRADFRQMVGIRE